MAQSMDPIGKIGSANPIQRVSRVGQTPRQAEKSEIEPDFMKILQQALEETNADQYEAERAADEFAAGRLSNIHDVLISAEKAAMSLRLTLEVRNKIVDAYREIMRMQL
ncbi:MAG TPA: flagellar hook-basal body complex protein FliE [Thermotogota bacterium]|nr:MAG: Flagellar hook-basal body complex protein FliE [Thermotogota bacterium ADurb.Bin062]HNW46048.1 flagellar hook-basal body complex protein FliE [Thermotogota bacterium]HNY82083.1 flagellar hook-basal body complex protein FliE [Thermotogota bacterium]HOD91250.1 flagellar hook-basal body complex protein FliE [Thermotogota bacterium]HOF22785.1 flagellar hook-basal body complex protein FliE [Thermotogota bacterium]